MELRPDVGYIEWPSLLQMSERTKGKVNQVSTNVSVARELNPGPWRHLTTIQWKSDGAAAPSLAVA